MRGDTSIAALWEKFDTFYGAHISKVFSHSDAALFAAELARLRTDFYLIVGYNRGYREAMLAAGAPMQQGAMALFVREEIKRLRSELSALKGKCASASRGRPKAFRADPVDLKIALRARSLLGERSEIRSLRAAILGAIAEHEASAKPLPITTTKEGHLKRIRRLYNSKWMPPQSQ